jgi:glutamine amidotransferase
MSTTSSWLTPLGETDSEFLFCRLLSYLEPLWSSGGIPAFEKRYDVVTGFAREILQQGAANFLYSDGVNLFAHGHRHTVPGDAVTDEPGLYVKTYQSKTGSDMTIPCQGLRTEGSCSYQALIATLPLNEHEWGPLKAGEIACFERGRRIR